MVYAGCVDGRVVLCDDPNDICTWSVGTSKRDSINEINLFVKRGNELRWFNKDSSVKLFYVILSSYDKYSGWLQYWTGSEDPKYRYIEYNFIKKSISIIPYGMKTSIEFTK